MTKEWSRTYLDTTNSCQTVCIFLRMFILHQYSMFICYLFYFSYHCVMLVKLDLRVIVFKLPIYMMLANKYFLCAVRCPRFMNVVLLEAAGRASGGRFLK
jgi:hypothetical protein